MKNIGKLYGNITTANNNNGLRQSLKIKHLIRGNAQFLAGKSLAMRPAASCNQDFFGCDRFPRLAQLQSMGINKNRPALINRDTVVFQPQTVKPLKACHFLVFGCNKLIPVKMRRTDRPAKCCRIGECF